MRNDRILRSILPVDREDWIMDIQNFDHRSLDSYIDIIANIVSMAFPYTAPLCDSYDSFISKVQKELCDNVDELMA